MTVKIRAASKNNSPVASILTLSHKKSMVYKYGCSDVRFHRFGGMALLFWNTIQQAKEEGFKELEMGRSDSNNLGLISYKEHWGAVGKMLSWAYPYSPHKIPGTWEKAILGTSVTRSRFKNGRQTLVPAYWLKNYIGKLISGIFNDVCRTTFVYSERGEQGNPCMFFT